MVIDNIHNDQKQTRGVILIAAGTGTAPMLQMIDQFLDERETSGLEPPTVRNSRNQKFSFAGLFPVPPFPSKERLGLRKLQKRPTRPDGENRSPASYQLGHL